MFKSHKKQTKKTSSKTLKTNPKQTRRVQQRNSSAAHKSSISVCASTPNSASSPHAKPSRHFSSTPRTTPHVIQRDVNLSEVRGTRAPPIPPVQPARVRRDAYDIDELMNGIERGDRRTLARAITLVESTREDHNQLANNLLCKILDHRSVNPAKQRDLATWESDQEFIKANRIPTFDQTEKQDALYPNLLHKHKPMPAMLFRNNGKPRGQLRIGISGTPGVGKSTFLEHFGMHLIKKYGLKIAVLSIDPSSLITGGSILGDKTRMQRLSLEENAYIRPSPSGGILGGIAQATGEAITLCEFSGVDVVFVETVGVGQSEVHVAQVTDMLVTLLNAGGAGTELQGIKKGMMEEVDLLVVTKADGELYNSACRTTADYRTALQMTTTRSHSYGWSPRVMMNSIKEDSERYMDNIWGNILDYEHCLLQPVSKLSPDALARLNFIVDRAQSIQHSHHVDDSKAQSSSTTPDTQVSIVKPLHPKNEEKVNHSVDQRTLLDVKRANQRVQWMWNQINQTMMTQFKKYIREDKESLPVIQFDLISDLLTPRIAAQKSFDSYLQHTINNALEKEKSTGQAGKH